MLQYLLTYFIIGIAVGSAGTFFFKHLKKVSKKENPCHSCAANCPLRQKNLSSSELCKEHRDNKCENLSK